MDGLAELLANAQAYVNDTGNALQDKISVQAHKEKSPLKTYAFSEEGDTPIQDKVFGAGGQLNLTDALSLFGKGFQGNFHNFKRLGGDRFREGSMGAKYDFGPGNISAQFNKEQFNQYDPNNSREVQVALDNIGKFGVKQNTANPDKIKYEAETRIPLEGLAAMLELKGAYDADKQQPEVSAQFTKKF